MPQTINILFFAALADALNCKNQQLELPENVSTVNELLSYLTHRKDKWLALEDSNIRCAVNQDIVKMDHPIQSGDEVAFFPPVTGG